MNLVFIKILEFVMKSLVLAAMLAISSVAVSVVAPTPAVAQSIQDLRAEVAAKLGSKISMLQGEIALLQSQLAQPGLTPSQIGQITASLNAKKAELRSTQLQLARVDRLSYRALLSLNSRLPISVSPA